MGYNKSNNSNPNYLKILMIFFIISSSFIFLTVITNKTDFIIPDFLKKAKKSSIILPDPEWFPLNASYTTMSPNMVSNGDFSSGSSNWLIYKNDPDFIHYFVNEEGSINAPNPDIGDSGWEAITMQPSVGYEDGYLYKLEFDYKAWINSGALIDLYEWEYYFANNNTHDNITEVAADGNQATQIHVTDYSTFQTGANGDIYFKLSKLYPFNTDPGYAEYLFDNIDLRKWEPNLICSNVTPIGNWEQNKQVTLQLTFENVGVNDILQNKQFEINVIITGAETTSFTRIVTVPRLINPYGDSFTENINFIPNNYGMYYFTIDVDINNDIKEIGAETGTSDDIRYVHSTPIKVYGPPLAPTMAIDTPSPTIEQNISLSWTLSTGADNYTLYRHTSQITTGNLGTEVKTISGQSTSDTVPGIGNWYYAVIANNETGSSLPSNSPNITILEDLVPNADFSANETSILEGQWVAFTFTGSEGNIPATFQWNFGDGSPNSTEQNPIYQYNQEGNYSVSLTIRDNFGEEDTITKVEYIIVINLIPIANFTANSTTIFEGEWVQFTFTGFEGDPPEIYDWDFGDGSPHSSDQNPVHQFISPNNYTITLFIVDSDFDIDSEIKIDFIQVLADLSPNANFTANITSILEGQWVQFTFTGNQGNTPANFEWDFGDGSPISSDINPVHQFNNSGTFQVVLIIHDYDGDFSTYNITIQVDIPKHESDKGGIGVILLANSMELSLINNRNLIIGMILAIGITSSAVGGVLVLYKKGKIPIRKRAVSRPKYKKGKDISYFELKTAYEEQFRVSGTKREVQVTKKDFPTIKPKEKEPKTKEAMDETRIKKAPIKVKVGLDENIQYIKSLEKEELIQIISNFEKDMTDILPATDSMLLETKEWIREISNYPLSRLTENDAMKLNKAIKEWEKIISKTKS